MEWLAKCTHISTLHIVYFVCVPRYIRIYRWREGERAGTRRERGGWTKGLEGERKDGERYIEGDKRMKDVRGLSKLIRVRNKA